MRIPWSPLLVPLTISHRNLHHQCDEDGGQELATVPNTANPTEAPQNNSGFPSDGAALRGRDTPGGGVIRL